MHCGRGRGVWVRTRIDGDSCLAIFHNVGMSF